MIDRERECETERERERERKTAFYFGWPRGESMKKYVKHNLTVQFTVCF